MKLLMVTCRNIDKNGGENALIMGRHAALYNQYSIETDIIFFHKNTENNSTQYLGIQFIECKKDDLYKRLDELLATGCYQGIVVSGFYDKEFNQYIRNKKKSQKILYIVDIHATIKEIYEYCIPDLYHILGTRYLYLKKKNRFIDSLKTADYAFIVSDEEIKEVNTFLPKNHINFVKIRCGCYNLVDKAEYFIQRDKQRNLLNIEPGTLAFVYSGSTDRWQKFDDTVKLFEKIQSTGIKCQFAFYMRLAEPEKEKLYSILGKENVLVRWVTPDEMKKELTAYDVGVLLRDYKWTNRVAFPNKFSDYIASGLTLVLSEAVDEPYKLAKKYNLEMFDINNITQSVESIRNLREKQLNQYLAKCMNIVSTELFYEKQVQQNALFLINSMEKISQ